MEEAFFDLADFLRRPSLMETFVDILLCAVPIWLAVMIGLVIGWSWRPRWTGLVYLGLRSKFRFLLTAAAPPGFGARRLWLAFTALSVFSACRAIWFNLRNKGKSTVLSSTEDAESVERSDEPDRSVFHLCLMLKLFSFADLVVDFQVAYLGTESYFLYLKI